MRLALSSGYLIDRGAIRCQKAVSSRSISQSNLTIRLWLKVRGEWDNGASTLRCLPHPTTAQPLSRAQPAQRLRRITFDQLGTSSRLVCCVLLAAIASTETGSHHRYQRQLRTR